MLELLTDFSSFCNSHQLRYILGYGTCLGAARHKGFIPWDDDIDVCMPYEDYLSFLRLYRGKHVLFTCKKFKYAYPFGKLVYANTRGRIKSAIDTFGVFIDIFPMFMIDTHKYAAVFSKLRRCQFKLSSIYRVPVAPPPTDYYKSLGYGFIAVRKTKHAIIYFVKRLRVFWFPQLIYCRKLIHLLTLAKGGDGYVGPDESLFDSPRIIFPTDLFNEPTPMEFEQHTFAGPTNVSDYLERCYGPGYMTPPPPNERRSHGYSFYRTPNKTKNR